jgi:hypothetical protein
MFDIRARIDGQGALSTVPNRPDAVDATIFIDGNYTGEVTLLFDLARGKLSAWGEAEHWASHSLQEFLHPDCLWPVDPHRVHIIEEAVRRAVKQQEA